MANDAGRRIDAALYELDQLRQELEAVVAMAFRASSEDIARICHAHPSLSEVTKEAALAVDKRALNF